MQTALIHMTPTMDAIEKPFIMGYDISMFAVLSLQPSSIEMLMAAAVKEESFRNILLYIIGKYVRQ